MSVKVEVGDIAGNPQGQVFRITQEHFYTYGEEVMQSHLFGITIERHEQIIQEKDQEIMNLKADSCYIEAARAKQTIREQEKEIAELKEANVEKAAKIVDLIETCRLQRATIAQLQAKSKETEDSKGRRE